MTVGEGGIRVPLIIAGPDIPKGQVRDAFAYVWDILPTVLDLTGAVYPVAFGGREIEKPRGRSMMPVIGSSAQEIYGPEELVGGEMAGGKWMRQGSFKAVSIPVVAIGGINHENVSGVIAAGAAGAAVISTVATAEDMASAARALKRRIVEARRVSGGG